MKSGSWTIASFVLLASGCTAMMQDFSGYGKNYRPIPLHMISIGDEKESVAKVLGTPANVIGSKPYPSGVIEVWEYQRWQADVGSDRLEETYWVYFLDGRVAQWGRPGDWEREADRGLSPFFGPSAMTGSPA